MSTQLIINTKYNFSLRAQVFLYIPTIKTNVLNLIQIEFWQSAQRMFDTFRIYIS